MNSLATPPIPPHFHEHTRLSPSRAMSTPSSARKRKASNSPAPEDDLMSTSPAIVNAQLPAALMPSSRKRVRKNLSGRALPVDRLLETLDADSIRSILQTICEKHPEMKDEVVQLSPRPSIASTINVLKQYHKQLMSAFPLDPNPRSDYCYDCVRPQFQALLSALSDYTPHFLPPNEQQFTVSLQYLDSVTQVIHDLPQWDSPQHNLHKHNAYEEISHAWVCVIREASKRGGGIGLQHGGWEEKLRRHNEVSEGRIQEAYDELVKSLGWLRQGANIMGHNGQQQQSSIRQQLFSGTYGIEQPAMRAGRW